MKKLEIVDSFGDSIVVEPELGLYTVCDFMGNKMPSLAIELYSYDEEEFRDLYAVLTVNFGEFFPAKNCAYIDTNNNSFTGQLLNLGICSDTGLKKQSGFCEYPLWRFEQDFLKEIDVHGLYNVYEKKFDSYIKEGGIPPIEARSDKILKDVLSALKVEEIALWFAVEDGEVEASRGSEKWVGADFYRYLLNDVCEYQENGAVKGLDLDLCHDFYDLCKLNGVDYAEYNKTRTEKNSEFWVILWAGDGRPSKDLKPFNSFRDANSFCEQNEWLYVDKHGVKWNMDIEEREPSINHKIADASARSKVADNGRVDKSDYFKE